MKATTEKNRLWPAERSITQVEKSTPKFSERNSDFKAPYFPLLKGTTFTILTADFVHSHQGRVSGNCS